MKNEINYSQFKGIFSSFSEDLVSFYLIVIRKNNEMLNYYINRIEDLINTCIPKFKYSRKFSKNRAKREYKNSLKKFDYIIDYSTNNTMIKLNKEFYLFLKNNNKRLFLTNLRKIFMDEVNNG